MLKTRNNISQYVKKKYCFDFELRFVFYFPCFRLKLTSFVQILMLISCHFMYMYLDFRSVR